MIAWNVERRTDGKWPVSNTTRKCTEFRTALFDNSNQASFAYLKKKIEKHTLPEEKNKIG
jgi:hypothetical protein